MTPAIQGTDTSSQIGPCHLSINSALKTTKKVALLGFALLMTGAIVYLCACDRTEESWCVLKEISQINSNLSAACDLVSILKPKR